MKKKVLVIAYFFPPVGGGGVQRTTKFVRYLSDFGWQPVVLTVENAAYSTFDPSLLDELPSDLPIYRTKAFQPTALYFKIKQQKSIPESDKNFVPVQSPSSSHWIKNAVSRFRAYGRWLSQAVLFPDDKIGWLPYALGQAKSIIHEHQPDLIYSTSAPFSSHIIGAKLAQQTGIPWVADFRDPYVGDRWSDKISPVHVYGRKVLEKNWVSKAKRVVVTTSYTHRDFAVRYPKLPSTHWVTITNGYDEADFQNVGSSESSPFFTLTFVGSAYMEANPDPSPLLAAISQVLSEKPDLRDVFRLQFIGARDRAYSQLLDHAIEQYQLQDVVSFSPTVPHYEAVQSMCNSSVLLLMRNTREGAELIISGKTFEYLRAERPILALIPSGAMEELLRVFSHVAILAPENTDGIKQQLDQWLALWQTGMLPKADDSYKAFERRELTKHLAGIFDEVVRDEDKP